MTILLHSLFLRPSNRETETWPSVRSLLDPDQRVPSFKSTTPVHQEITSMSSDESGWQLTESDPGVFTCARLLDGLTRLAN